MTLIRNVVSHKNFIRLLQKEDKLGMFNLGPHTEKEWFKILEVLECFRERDAKEIDYAIEQLRLDGIQPEHPTIDCLNRLKKAAEKMKERD